MTIRHPLIAQRVFGVPLLMHPDRLDAIAGALLRIWDEGRREGGPEAYTTSAGTRAEPGYRNVAGVAVIDIFGVLAHRGGLQADSSYILGYQTVARRLEAAVADRDVHSILLDIDSPGGEVAGVFDLARQIRAADASKPVYAAVDAQAASAGYLLASSAREISITPTGYAGSIGVVWRHANMAGALEQAGVEVTYLYAGDRKIDGNPFQPLSEPARAAFQADIEKIYGMFIERVAEYRSLDPRDVRDTQARTYLGADAIAAGLADRLETADELLARLTGNTAGAAARQSLQTTRSAAMPTEQTAAPEQMSATLETTEDEKARIAQARADGEAAGRTAERARIEGILGAEAAQGREQLARHLAFATSMTAEAATGILAESPTAAASTRNRLDAVMAQIPQPGIGPDALAAETGEADQRKSMVDEIRAGMAH